MPLRGKSDSGRNDRRFVLAGLERDDQYSDGSEAIMTIVGGSGTAAIEGLPLKTAVSPNEKLLLSLIALTITLPSVLPTFR